MVTLKVDFMLSEREKKEPIMLNCSLVQFGLKCKDIEKSKSIGFEQNLAPSSYMSY